MVDASRPARPTRLYYLDALRGLAALSVIFWHWQHFFFVGASPGAIDTARLPLWTPAAVLYQHGWLAVDLFFEISGFTFFWLYRTAVAEGQMSPRRFVALRLSRLYPLHFATLVVVLVLQFVSRETVGAAFVYPNNGLAEFVAHLAFANGWFADSTVSFNGPAWSVSVEMLLYGAFFLACRRLPITGKSLLTIATCSFVVLLATRSPIARGLAAFFVGGLMHWAYGRILLLRQRRAVTLASLTAAVACWAIALAVFYAPIGFDVAWARLNPPVTSITLVAHSLLRFAVFEWPVYAIFPLTILGLVLAETVYGSRIERLAGTLGDISYSSYLWHFPLQCLVALGAQLAGWGDGLYYSTAFMLGFFAVLAVISYCSHRWFEVPAQTYLRRSRSTVTEPPLSSAKRA